MTRTGVKSKLVRVLSRLFKRGHAKPVREDRFQHAMARIEVLEKALAAEQAKGSRATITAVEGASCYEASVNLACRDLVRPGDVCFDVGSHTGHLTLLLSRLCGPRGHVCAFEANPTNVKLALANFAANNCNNVFTVNRCVYERSGETLSFHLPGGEGESQAGSLYYGADFPSIKATSVALDDFVAATGLAPALVKMDIEGAELDALKGMRRTINAGRPHIILEQARSDENRCFNLMREWSYRAIDLHNYRFLEKGSDDFPPATVLRNVLFLHRDRINDTPFGCGLHQGPLAVSPRAIEIRQSGAARFQKWNDRVGKGRYAFEVKLQTEDTKSYIELKVCVDGKLHVHYGGSPKWIADSYGDFILDLREPASVEVETFDPAGTAAVRMAAVNYAPLLGFHSAPASLFI
jgi:FkbM family methyltransferase